MTRSDTGGEKERLTMRENSGKVSAIIIERGLITPTHTPSDSKSQRPYITLFE